MSAPFDLDSAADALVADDEGAGFSLEEAAERLIGGPPAREVSQSGRDAFRASIYEATAYEPDTAAKDYQAAEALGLPFETAAAERGRVGRALDFRRQADLDPNESPATARFLQAPRWARVARDETGFLANAETYWQGLKNAREQDLNQRRVTSLQRRALAGLASDAEEDELRQRREIRPPDLGIGEWEVPSWAKNDRHLRGFFEVARFLETAPITAVETFGTTKEGLVSAAKGAGVGGVLAVGAAAILGAPAAPFIGLLIGGGAAAGALLSAGSLEGAAAFDEMRSRGVSEDVARAVAVPVGLIAGAIEVGALGVQLRNVPGVRSLVRRKVIEAAERPLVQRVLIQTLTVSAAEAGEEVAQEATQIGGDFVADLVEGRDPSVTFETEIDGERITLTGWDAFVARSALAGRAGGQAGLIFGGATGGIQAAASLAGRWSQVERARRRTEDLKKFADALGESKLGVRAPDAATAHAKESIAEHGAPETAYIPIERLRELFQNADAEQMAELENAVPGIRDRVAEAAATGADVEIPSEVFATRVLSTALGRELIQDVRYDTAEMTAREAEAEAPVIEKELRELLDARDQAEAGVDPIGVYRARLERNLVESGAYDAGTATRMAQIEEANLRALAESQRLTPEEAVGLLGQMKLEVEALPRKTLADLVLRTPATAPAEEPGVPAAGEPGGAPAAVDATRAAPGGAAGRRLLDEILAAGDGQLEEFFITRGRTTANTKGDRAAVEAAQVKRDAEVARVRGLLVELEREGLIEREPLGLAEGKPDLADIEQYRIFATPAARGELVEADGQPDLEEPLIDRERTAELLEDIRADRRPELEGMPKYPILGLLNRLGGINPASAVAGELRNMGVGPRTMPGLFRKKGGFEALDTLIRSENPTLQTLPVTPGTDYFAERELLDAIRAELAGRPIRTDEQARAIAEGETTREAMLQELERLGLNVAAPDAELLDAIEAEVRRQQAEPVPRGTEEGRDDLAGFEFFQDRPLKTESAAFRAWFKDSKVVDESGAPLVVYHGTTTTVTEPGARTEGDANAREWLQAQAAEHGIAEWGDVAGIFERWAGSEEGARRGVTDAIARRARRMARAARGTSAPPTRRIGFDAFRLPAGEEEEIGAHFGTAEQASARGDVFGFYLSIQNPIRLRDLGSWEPVDVIPNARAAGVAISDEEARAVDDAAELSVALRELLLSKGVDGIVYRNEAEGAGDSWIAFKPEQIKSTENRGTFDPNDLRILFQPARQTTEEIVGAARKYLQPDELAMRSDAAVQLRVIFDSLPPAAEIAAVAEAGAEARGWYERSGRAIRAAFGDDAPRFTALLAALSPRQSVELNATHAINVWAAWIEAGRPRGRAEIIAAAEAGAGRKIMEAWEGNVVRALEAENQDEIRLSGPKVESFRRNLLGDDQAVTSDGWIATFLALEGDLGKVGRYRAVAARIRQAADYLTRRSGHAWTPAEVQETVWAWTKALREQRESAGESRTAQEIIRENGLDPARIAGAPNFSMLFARGVYRRLLADAGAQAEPVRGSDRPLAQGARKRAAAPASGARERALLRAAARVERAVDRARSELTTLYQPARQPGLFAGMGELTADERRVLDSALAGERPIAQLAPELGIAPDRFIAAAEGLAAEGLVELRASEFTPDPQARSMRLTQAGRDRLGLDRPQDDGGQQTLFQSAYHGTRVKQLADGRFKLDLIGTGEGAQAYGWGLYFTSKREVAEFYRKALATRQLDSLLLDGLFVEPLAPHERLRSAVWFDEHRAGRADSEVAVRAVEYAVALNVLEEVRVSGFELPAAIDVTRRFLEREERSYRGATAEGGNAAYHAWVAAQKEALERIAPRLTYEPAKEPGQVFKVELPEDSELMDWNKPASEQSSEIRLAMNRAAASVDARRRFKVRQNEDAREFYMRLAYALTPLQGNSSGTRNDAAASRTLATHGIKGHSYIGHESQERNFVIYDEAAIGVVETFYQSQREQGEDVALPDSAVVFDPSAPPAVPSGENWTALRLIDGTIVYPTGGAPTHAAAVEKMGIAPELVADGGWIGDDGRYFETPYSDQPSDSQRMGEIARAAKRVAARRRLRTETRTAPQREQTESAAFKAWFGDSKVVDAEGKPLIVYHGTASDFEEFRAGDASLGIWLTNRTGAAGEYAEVAQRLGGGPAIVPAYVSLQNPANDAQLEQAQADDARSNGRASSRREAGLRVRSLLQERGFDGYMAPDGLVVIAFDPTQIKSAIGNRGTFDPRDPSILRAGPPEAPRGSLSFDPELRDVTMRLAASRDLSTFLHEGGHLWLERLRRLAQREGASAGIKADLSTVREWWKGNAASLLSDAKRLALELPDIAPETIAAVNAATEADVVRMADAYGTPAANEADSVLLTALHEQWARGVETYLREGKAPSLELRDLFSHFLVWLTSVYRNASSLRVELNDEVRGVMDRLVATEAQMAALAASEEMTPLSEELQAELMTEPERVRYETLATKTRLGVREKLTAAALAEVRAQQTEAYADASKRIRSDVDQELDVRPAVLARHWLVTGEWRGSVPAPDDLPRGKLSREALAGMYGEQVKTMPQGRAGWVARSGDDSAWHPDQVAELFGFETGHDLVTAIRGLPSRATLLETETKARLRAEFGDRDQAVAEGAASLLSEIPEQVEMLLLEELSLARRAGAQATPQQMLRQVARRIVTETKARDLAPHRYRAAAARAAKTAAKAIAAKDYRTAKDAKRQQALSTLLEFEARKAKEESDSAGDYFRRVQEGTTRKIIVKAGANYAGQMDALLARFDLRNRSLRALDRKGSLAKWIAEFEATGEVVPIPEQMRNDAFRKNWRELTVGELRALRESVQAIEHLARSKVEYATAHEKRQMEDVRGELVSAVERNIAKRKKPKGLPNYSDDAMERARRTLSGLSAGLQKIEFLVDWLDGGDPQGVWRRYVFTPIAEAEVRRNDLNAKYTAAIAELVRPLANSGDYTTRAPVPELGANYTRGELVAIGLNLGNQGNLDKELGGYGWSEGQVMAALQSRLSDADWGFIQGVWDLIDTLWPEIAEQEKRLTGVVPERVVPREFEVVTPTGKRIAMRGGYYPVIYDPNKARWAYKRASKGVYQDVEDHFHRAVTGHGHTMSRTEVTGPLLLSLGVIPRHLDQVIHDLTHRETLLRVDKLLDSDVVHGALEEHIGQEYARLFRPWLQAIAHDRIGDNKNLIWWQKLLRTVRVNSTVFTLGLRATTLGVQPIGHSNAIGLLRTRLPHWQTHYVSGMRNAIRHPVASFRAAVAASGEMRHRANNIDRDLRDAIRREFATTPLERGLSLASVPGVLAMRLIGLVQFYLVDLPVWTGAFQGAQLEGLAANEAEAATFADAMVRMSQSSGSVKDLAEIQRGSEWQRMFTTFFSYMNVVGNQIQGALRDTHGVRDMPGFLVSWVLFLSIPGLGSMLLRDALTDDRDDDEKRWNDLERILQALGVWDFAGTIPLLREGVAALRYGSRPQLPIQRAFGAASDLMQDIAKEDRNAREILFDGARVGSIALGLPSDWLLRELEQEIKERE